MSLIVNIMAKVKNSLQWIWKASYCKNTVLYKVRMRGNWTCWTCSLPMCLPLCTPRVTLCEKHWIKNILSIFIIIQIFNLHRTEVSIYASNKETAQEWTLATNHLFILQHIESYTFNCNINLIKFCIHNY